MAETRGPGRSVFPQKLRYEPLTVVFSRWNNIGIMVVRINFDIIEDLFTYAQSAVASHIFVKKGRSCRRNRAIPLLTGS